METTVLGTRVSREFAEKVNAYCKGNGLTPSELIKSLLEEELLNREPLTSVYDNINKRFAQLDHKLRQLTKLNLENLYRTCQLSYLVATQMWMKMLDDFKGLIPPEHLETFNNIKKVAEENLEAAKTVDKALQEALKEEPS
jgi:antitoxin component of RelBE/YafQ-DinJ toxin-antitoxin module